MIRFLVRFKGPAFFLWYSGSAGIYYPEQNLQGPYAGHPVGFPFLSYLIHIAANMIAVCHVHFCCSEKSRLNYIYVFAVTIVT